MAETIRPPKPPPFPPDVVSPGHVKRRRKRWARPRSYRREFMRTHPGLADELVVLERRKARAFMFSRVVVAVALGGLVLGAWVWLLVKGL